MRRQAFGRGPGLYGIVGGFAALCLPLCAGAMQKQGIEESRQEARRQVERAGAANLPQVTPEERSKIEAAIPQKAQAKPKKPRKVLVMTLNMRDGVERRGHSSIPHGNLAIQLMGEKTGAYTAVFNNDISVLKPENLKQFDAIVFNNTVGVLTEDPALRESLIAFVRDGKGLVGLHAAGATFVQYPRYDQFPEFGVMLGGYENGGHPWGPKDVITIKIDDPKNPVNAAFKGQSFEISDEVFQFRDHYSRKNMRVLVSIDTDKSDMNPKRRFLPEREKDRDFAMSWLKKYGKGRVFYTSFGHNTHIFWNAPVLQHILAGIQFATGDLKASAEPSAK